MRKIRWYRVFLVLTCLALFAWACHVPEPTPEQLSAYEAYTHAQKVNLHR